MKTAIDFLGVSFKNPVITASGTYGFGREYGQYYELSDIGGVCVKGLTLAPRQGNPPPRIAETPSGILNSVGLQNPGVEYFIKNELPFLKQAGTRVIANVAGSTIEDYCKMVEIVSDSDTDLIELNISCPNVKEGGVAFGTSCDSVANIVSAVRPLCKKPLIVKLSPNVTSITDIAKTAQECGADALSLINTLTGMVVDIHIRKPLLYNNTGGLSGPAVRPVAVRMVSEVYRAVNIPIIGMGGIATGEDAIEFLLAGASLVAVGTYNFVDPMACIKVRDGIEDYLRQYSETDINDIIGTLQLN